MKADQYTGNECSLEILCMRNIINSIVSHRISSIKKIKISKFKKFKCSEAAKNV